MRRLCAALAVVAAVTDALTCRAPRTVRARTAGLLRALDARQPGAASRRTAAGAAAVGALVAPDLAGAATTPAVEDVVENPALVWKQGEKRDAAGLCVYAEKSTTAAGDYSATPQLGVRQLLSLLKSRYGLLPDAQRQLSLLFSLLDPPLQPSEAIASLAARYENATVAAVDVVDGGSYAVSDAALQRILGFIVTEAGCGYGAPPDVTVSAPPGDDARSRPALAVVDDKGRLRGVELVDGGVGYVPSGPENDLTVVLDVAPLRTIRGGTAATGGGDLGSRSSTRGARNVPPPTAARWAPRDAASSSLTALLGVGLVPVWDGATHKFPAAAFGRIEGASRSMRSDMTPVRRPVELRGGQLVRLALAGAICTATTRAVLNPLELSRTRAQAAASGGARDDDAAHGAASPWLGVEATAAAGAALGTSSFGRCLLFAVIITVQLLLFDFCRDKLQVSPENLSLGLDVFADRLSFYEY
ncbi:hypothetical protein JL722_8631 [Aureococcus anophagefferens]|nr:hypothetical protein JL722_8631 [Aureococcus anophagefferens]